MFYSMLVQKIRDVNLRFTYFFSWSYDSIQLQTLMENDLRLKTDSPNLVTGSIFRI